MRLAVGQERAVKTSIRIMGPSNMSDLFPVALVHNSRQISAPVLFDVMYRDQSMAPAPLSEQSTLYSATPPVVGYARCLSASCRSLASESAQVSGGLTSASYVQLRFIPVCKA